MKKVCSLLLALALMLTMLAGCQKEPVTTDDKALALSVLENYMDAVVEFDFKKAASYTNDSEAAMAEIPYENLDDAVAKTVASMPENLLIYEESITDFAEAVFTVMQDNTEYKILSFEEDGENYVGTVEYTNVNTEEFDIETMMTKLMADIDYNELAAQLLADGTITEDMTEEEIQNILFPALFMVMTDTVKETEVATITTEEEISVIKVDGKWVISQESAQ